MYVLEQFANRMAKKIVEQGSPHSAGEIAHGIELVVINILNLIFVWSIAYIGGFIGEALITSLVYVGYRIFSGGGHLKGPWRCFAFGNISLLGLSWLAQNSPLQFQLFPWVMLGASFLFSSWVNYVYAPVSGYEITEEQRRKNRRILFSLLLTGFIASLLLLYHKYEWVAIAWSLAVLYQGMLLLPSVNRFLKSI